MFMNTADDSEDVPKVEKGQPKYESYKLSEGEWTLLDLIHEVLEVCSLTCSLLCRSTKIIVSGSREGPRNVSAEYYPTIWRILPAYEELLADWRKFATDRRMVTLRPAIEAGIGSLEKYYNKTDNSPAHIVSMCE